MSTYWQQYSRYGCVEGRSDSGDFFVWRGFFDIGDTNSFLEGWECHRSKLIALTYKWQLSRIIILIWMRFDSHWPDDDIMIVSPFTARQRFVDRKGFNTTCTTEERLNALLIIWRILATDRQRVPPLDASPWWVFVFQGTQKISLELAHIPRNK